MTPISPASPNIIDPPTILSFLPPNLEPTPPVSPTETTLTLTLHDSSTAGSLTKTTTEPRAETPLLDEPEDLLQFLLSFPTEVEESSTFPSNSATAKNQNSHSTHFYRLGHKRRHFKTGESPLEKQRRREYFTNKARRVRKPRFNQNLSYQLR